MLKVKFILSLLSLLFLSTTMALAQCIEGNCKNGDGTYLYPSGAKYIGGFVNYLANGFGKLYFANGDVYQGEWRQHKREGKGRFISMNKYEYDGEFYANEFDGNGRMVFANNDSYEGEFKAGVFHGDGTYISSDGRRISGEWVDGNPKEEIQHATPKLKTENRQETNLAAEYKDCNTHNCHNEEGRFVYRDGTVFIGEFKFGQPEGHGKVEYVNGNIYNGGWKNHAPNGEGIVHYHNGRSYGANWSNGVPLHELEADHPMIKETVTVDESEETKIWAVIIGVSRYNHMPTLRYTDDDAFHLYAFLKSPEGGALPDDQIALLIDEHASRKEIISQLQQVFYRADENDVVLMYFSGHGLEGKMIPSDFDGFNNAVKYEEVKNIIDQSRAQHKIVITDACHSGSLVASKSLMDTQLQQFYQQLAASKNGVAFITSSKSEEESMESTGLRHGIFSHFLIKGLQGLADEDDNGQVTIMELYDYVNHEVQTYTNHQQNPLIYGDFDRNMAISMVRK